MPQQAEREAKGFADEWKLNYGYFQEIYPRTAISANISENRSMKDQ